MTLTIHPAPKNRPCRPRSSPAGRLLGAVVLGTALLTGTVAGCAAAPELDPGAARELQAQVLTVTEAAAANDPAAALKQLDGLVQKLDDAAGRGGVSFKRHQSIQQSIDTVRADLNARLAAAQAEAAAAAEQATAARAAAEQEAAAEAASQAAQVPAPVLAPAPAPPVDTDPGKGKDKAKDKGKDKGYGAPLLPRPRPGNGQSRELNLPSSVPRQQNAPPPFRETRRLDIAGRLLAKHGQHFAELR